jgi:tetratricopeptide (TPR) repeat protein
MITSLKQSAAKVIKKSTVLAAAIALSTAFVSPLSLALPAEAELDRYLLAAEKYIEAEQYEKAHDYLKKAGGLNLSLPANYYYYLGTVLEFNGQNSKAREQFEKYAGEAGRDGEFYTVALEKITEIEEVQTSREAVKKAFESQSSITKSAVATTTNSSSEDDEFEEGLKALYATESLKEALIKHTNAILDANTFSGGIIQKEGSKGVRYQISIGNNNQVVVTKQDHRKQPALITTDRTNIFGMDPFVNHECDINRGSCWVRHPESIDKWVEIAYDERSASDLSKSLTSLIRALQSGQ